MTHRINGRRIHHLRPEVAQLHSLHVAQLLDRISRADDFRVGCHKAVHIRPDFQDIRIQRSRNDGSRVIRTTPSQVCDLTGILIRRNKSRHDGYLRYLTESFAYQLIGKFRVQNMLVMFFLCLDKCTGVEPHSSLNQGSHDNGRQPFSIAHNSGRSLGRKIPNQINPLKNILQFT
ncbi:unknown [Bacteroides sp. CAG:875]|nr:unknown [Bacteroides sp. CAG:875]